MRRAPVMASRISWRPSSVTSRELPILALVEEGHHLVAGGGTDLADGHDRIEPFDGRAARDRADHLALQREADLGCAAGSGLPFTCTAPPIGQRAWAQWRG